MSAKFSDSRTNCSIPRELREPLPWYFDGAALLDDYHDGLIGPGHCSEK